MWIHSETRKNIHDKNIQSTWRHYQILQVQIKDNRADTYSPINSEKIYRLWIYIKSLGWFLKRITVSAVNFRKCDFTSGKNISGIVFLPCNARKLNSNLDFNTFQIKIYFIQLVVIFVAHKCPIHVNIIVFLKSFSMKSENFEK